ncbi:MAG TPA: response regulator [Povalibacter sp.]|nr:response regulator [Povalibacter sp.]
MQSMAPEKYLPGVLIVDDSEPVRSFLRTAVEAMARVIEAPDAEQALEILENHGDPIDLMLLDHVLPGRSGLDLLRITKRNWPEMPVIILTAFGSEDLAVEAFREGAKDYLRKPIAPDALMRAVAANLPSTGDTVRYPGNFAERSAGVALANQDIRRTLTFWRTLTSLKDAAQEGLDSFRRFETRMVIGVWGLVLVTILMIYIFTRSLGWP